MTHHRLLQLIDTYPFYSVPSETTPEGSWIAVPSNSCLTKTCKGLSLSAKQSQRGGWGWRLPGGWRQGVRKRSAASSRGAEFGICDWLRRGSTYPAIINWVCGESKLKKNYKKREQRYHSNREKCRMCVLRVWGSTCHVLQDIYVYTTYYVLVLYML